MKEGCTRYLPGGRCAIIICFLKGAMEASMPNCEFGEHFLKGMMLEVNFEGQVRVK